MVRKKGGSSDTNTWSDLVKKAVFASIGSAAFAKQAMKEGRLKKEVIETLKSKVEKSKEDLLDVLAVEVSRFLGKINVADEVQKALQGLVINLTAQIDFDKKDKKKMKPRVKIKKATAKKK